MADCCSGGVRLIYSCSGAADVGLLADRVARLLKDEGFARMTCLAGVGADLSGFIQSAKAAEVNITIDGCAVGCARKALERHGIASLSFVLSDLGFHKGETAVTEDAVRDAGEKIKNQSGKTGAKSDTGISGGCSCSTCS